MRVFTPAFWESFWQHTVEVVAGRGLLILAVFAGYFIVRSIVNRLIDASAAKLLARQEHAGTGEERANRLKTLRSVSKSVARYVLFFILIIMLLDAAGANVAGIITTAGVGGIAIGLGAQRLVRDVIAGFLIIMEDQFAVGDYVTISGVAGTIAGQGAVGVVENLGMRITRVRDDTGRRWILANGDITAVINHSREPVESSIEIGIGPDQDVSKAEAIINNAGAELKAASEGKLMSEPQCEGVVSADGTRTTLRVTFVADPRNLGGEQVRIRTELYARLRQQEIAVA